MLSASQANAAKATAIPPLGNPTPCLTLLTDHSVRQYRISKFAIPEGGWAATEPAQHVHSRCPISRNALPVRPAYLPRAADHSVASGPARAHADSRYSLRIEPAGHFLNWQQDPQANFLARVVFPEKVTSFRVIVDLVAEMTVINPFDFFLEPEAETVSVSVRFVAASRHCRRFCVRSKTGPAIARRWIKSVDLTERADRRFPGRPSISGSITRSSYLIRLEPGVQTPEETLKIGRGSCRDYGLAAGADLTAPRARGPVRLGLLDSAQARCEAAGWAGRSASRTSPICTPGARCICRARVGSVSIPTSGLFAGEGHIPLAAAPDPLFGRADQRKARTVRSRVRARDADHANSRRPPRHQTLHRRAVVADRQARPTPSITNCKGRTCGSRWGASRRSSRSTTRKARNGTTPPWGPTSGGCPKSLIRRLHDAFAPGGLLHFGQGKWYPGEQLPRWALACYLAQGRPPDLAQSRADRRAATSQSSYTFDDAERFANCWPSGLESIPAYAVPAFEDPVYFLQREGQLPINVDPADSKLKDTEERTRLAARVRAGAERAGGLCAAAATRHRTASRAGLGKRAVDAARQAPGADAGRFADRLAAADAAACPGSRRPSIRFCTRPIPSQHVAALPVPERHATASEWRRAQARVSARTDRRHRQQASLAARSRAGVRRIGAVGGADGAVRRAARWPAARVPAAARRPSKTIWSWWPRSKTPPQRSRCP